MPTPSLLPSLEETRMTLSSCAPKSSATGGVECHTVSGLMTQRFCQSNLTAHLTDYQGTSAAADRAFRQPTSWAAVEPAMTEEYLSRREAAELCDLSEDTVKRAIKDGRLPHARRNNRLPNSPWEVPASDLIAAGMLEDRHAVNLQSRIENAKYGREIHDLRAKLAVIEARNAGLEESLRLQREHNAFLQKLVERTTSGLGKV